MPIILPTELQIRVMTIGCVLGCAGRKSNLRSKKKWEKNVRARRKEDKSQNHSRHSRKDIMDSSKESMTRKELGYES